MRPWHRIMCACMLSVGIISSGMAAAVTIQSSIAFRAPVSLTKIKDIAFGDVTAGQASTYRITPTGTLSVVSGSGQLLGGSTQAGQVKITGSQTQKINISISNYQADKGVTPKNASCRYNNGGTVTPCNITNGTAPRASGRTLLVGLDVAADGTQTHDMIATPSFDITVVYN